MKKKIRWIIGVSIILIFICTGCTPINQLEGEWMISSESATSNYLTIARDDDGVLQFAQWTERTDDAGDIQYVGTAMAGTLTVENDTLTFILRKVLDAKDFDGDLDALNLDNTQNGETIVRYYTLDGSTLSLYADADKTQAEGIMLTGAFTRQ